MYSSASESFRFQVRMSADVRLIDRLCADASSFLAEVVSPQLQFELNLILREAVCNAIVHGSGSDPAQEVGVAIEREPDKLTIRVSDAGPGWGWRDHGWTPPPPVNEGGRGLYIVRHYSDGVQFNESGNEIIITKRYEVQEEGMDSTKKQANREVVMGQSLSAGTLDQYRSQFKSFIESGVQELILDCSALEVVDSMGIGLLVATHNSLTKVGGELIMVKTSEPIYNLMSTMRLNRHFTVRRK